MIILMIKFNALGLTLGYVYVRMYALGYDATKMHVCSSLYVHNLATYVCKYIQTYHKQQRE